MNKLETFNCKKTDWIGLWDINKTNYFTSQNINLSALKNFKGNVQFVVCKNKFYEKGSNRPKMIMMLRDSSPYSNADIKKLSTSEMNQDYIEEIKKRFTLFDYNEVQWLIDKVCEDALRGYLNLSVEAYFGERKGNDYGNQSIHGTM